MAVLKRKRLSLEEDDDDNPEGVQSRARRQNSARLSNDGSQIEESQDSSDDDMLEGQATQFLRKEEQNKAADNGIIESVICENFMCHTHLDVPLGPLINFIVGHNGSGKSAILTAITICLGGKATATNRGQSLKSFIKEGQDSSTLTVKIKNTSDSSYQHYVYGNTIIVERHFSRSGSSSFKLRSSSGKLVSTRKLDLDEICDYFALQIDNPMNVLTQDMARQFLHNSTALDKYKFFMKGTQLEHLDRDYLQIEQSLEKMTHDLHRNAKDVDKYEEEVRKAKALFMLSEKHDTLRGKIKWLVHQMAWAQVEEQERYVLAYDDELRKAAEIIENTRLNEVEASDTFHDAHQKRERANVVVIGLKDGLGPIQEAKDLAKMEFDKFKSEALTAQTEQRQIKVHLKQAEANVIKTKADIEEEHHRLEEANGGSHKKRLEEIEAQRTDVVAAKNRLHEHDNGIRQLEANKKGAAADAESFQVPMSSKRAELEQCELQLSSLMRDRGQRQGAYKPNMPRLLTAIQKDGGFREKPVGPMGYHVRLLKPLWSSILEKSFGAALETFIVTNKPDHSRLTSLMQQNGCMCPIFIENNTPIDTSNHEPDPSLQTILRVLEIDNDLVRKQLVINNSIEQTVLTELREDGVAALEGPSQQKVKQCFTLNKVAGSGLRISRGYGGGLSQTFIDPFRGVPRMKTDIEYQINSQRDIVYRLKAELTELGRQRRDKIATLTACEQAIVRHGRESGSLRLAVQSAQHIVDELQDSLENDAVQEGRLDALKAHLAEAQGEVTTHEGSYEDSVIAIDRIKESMGVSRRCMKDLDVQIAEVAARINRAEMEATKFSVRREAALRQKNTVIEQAKEAVMNQADLEKQREEQVEKVTQFIEQANRICPRVLVDAGETGVSLDKKLKKLNADLQRYEEKIGGNKQKIVEKATRAVEVYRQARREFESVENLAQLMKMTLVNRRNRWKQFRRYITARARVQFFYLLSERGFRGQLLLSHGERKLDLSVEPDETKTGKGRQTKTLSGGEKSFSTICLLLSLWDAMGAPIRCLDEFDVFMDSVNRDISMKMMIIAARRSIGRQFILITPQSMGPVDSDRDVKIIKMSDPERGQTTISFPSA